MTSTCVPGMLVRIQLFLIPGEERKFNRRRIVARIPTSNRAREKAAHTSVFEGISIIGVGNVSATGGKVGEGVAILLEGDGVGVDVSVSIAEITVGDGDSVGGGGVDDAVAMTG